MSHSSSRNLRRSVPVLLTVAAFAAVAMGNRAPAVDDSRAPERIPAHRTHPLRIDSLSSPTGPGSAEPFLAVAPDGRVFMSWLEQTSSGYALKLSRHDGSKWSSPTTIVARNDFFVNWADFPSVIALDNKRLAAHWLQRTGSSTYAYGVRIAQSSDGGVTWSSAITPHRDTAQAEHGFVALWNERGALGAAWLDGRKFQKGGHDMSNEMMLVSTTLQPNGTLGAETRLDERTCDCCQNAVAVTSDGPIIAYRNRSPDEIRDIYVTRRVRGAWTAGVAAHSDQWKIAACPVNGPSLAARGKRVALAWFTAANDSARVNVAFSDDAGATFSAPSRVDGGTPAGRVSATLLSDGDALITWVERSGADGAEVRARRMSRSGRAGEVVTIAASSAARASGFPKAVITGSSVMFAWTVPGKPSTVRIARADIGAFR